MLNFFNINSAAGSKRKYISSKNLVQLFTVSENVSLDNVLANKHPVVSIWTL